ncbi:MAG: FGGY family carbohydrate kinase [Planctomycetota bacterium]
MEALVGIDAGTSSVKALVVSALDGRTLGFAQREIEYARRTARFAEQDAREMVRRARETAREAIDKARRRGKADALCVGLSGQMHGGTLFGAGGKALTSIVTWEDQRATPGAIAEVRRKAGRAIRRSGCGFATGYLGATIASLGKADRRKVRHFLTTTDVMRRGLTGEREFTTDESNASSTGLFDTAKRRWNEELFEALELSPGIAPRVAGTWEIAGRVTRESARATGLWEGTPVCTGGGDQPMSMIGAGVVEEGDGALVNIGTGSQIARKIERYRAEEGLITFAFPGGGYSILGASLSGGAAFSWWRSVVEKFSFGELLGLAGETEAGSGGVVFTPLLAGTRARPELRGRFENLATHHGLKELTRAVLEGIVAELYGYSMKMGNGKDAFLRATGGLSGAQVVQEILAGFFRRPVKVRTGIAEAALGAAIVAAVGSGLCKGLVEATRKLSRKEEWREVRRRPGREYVRLREKYPVTRMLGAR